jgi:septal ring factor EnvC (AmiA/AmiB activator)
MNVSIFYKTYKSYIIAVCISLVCGFVLCCIWSGKNVSNLRNRIDQLRADTTELRQAARGLRSTNEKLKGELAAERETNQRITNRADSLERENQLQRAFIESIERANKELGTNNNDFRSILEAIRKRGAVKTPQSKDKKFSGRVG